MSSATTKNAIPPTESWSLSVKAIGSTLKECTSSSPPPTDSSSPSGSPDTTRNESDGGDSDGSNNATNKKKHSNQNEFTAEKNFKVVVSPDDALTSLYDQIEDVTGLKASQQRLIYRGRIIPSSSNCNKTKPAASDGETSTNNEEEESETEADGSAPKPEGESDRAETGSTEEEDMLSQAASPVPEKLPSEPTTTTTKIKDIVGLGDGHTIHLVKRQESSASNNGDGAASSSTTTNNRTTGRSNLSTTADREESLSGNGTASLLAALIGLGGLEDGGGSGDDGAAASRQRWRSARSNGSRASRGGRPHYRLTAEDLQPPDPGTLEPIRQNLMTIHTLLPHARNVGEAESPLDANRQWYRGQWLDVRDTVNQWLEATVVDLLTPDQVLPPRQRDDSDEDDDRERARQHRPQVLEPATDPAVGSGDLAGRRRLLLEPCDVGDADDEGGELEGFRRRASNAGVQLLLIHYNGWPHRWDEWIRSDSERLRPFRTRTRHPNMATYSSPTTQSPFNESPPTHIVNAEPGVERPAILPELSRAVEAIQELLTVVAAEETAQLASEQQAHLPWAARVQTPSDARPTVADFVDTKDEEEVDDEDSEDENALPPIIPVEESDNDTGPPAPSVETSSCTTAEQNVNSVQPQLRRRQLQMLAPLLDRLGRTLVDAAPHVAALASDCADNSNENEESVSTAEAVVAPSPGEDSNNPSTLGGLLSLLNRDRRRQNRTNSSSNDNENSNDNSNPTGDNDEPASPEIHQTWPVDPDYVDFATGAVNTTRGEVRSGPRSRSSNDDVAGLLGAYLAAASLGLNTSSGGGGGGADDNDDTASNVMGLGRLLRERGNGGGNGGPGIDIHIHAVVTAPGMPPTPIGGGTGLGGALGLAALGGLPTTGTTAARNPLTPTSRRGSSLLRHRTPPVVEEEDSLFSDLYSESPDPVDPNNSPEPEQGRRQERTSTSDNDFLSRLTHSSTRSASNPLGTPRRSSASGTPDRLHRQSSDASSSRRSSASGSSRRGSMFGRLFRRSRRSGSNRDL